MYYTLEKNKIVRFMARKLKATSKLHNNYNYLSLQTSMPTFKSPETCIRRRFSDFLGLHERLNGKFLHSGIVVPPAPEKSVVGELMHL